MKIRIGGTGLIVAILLVGLVVFGTARVHAEDAREFTEYSGMIGDSPVGMVLSFSGRRIADGSHYYYRKYLKDIPLNGMKDHDLTLIEPEGSVFVLHDVDRASIRTTPENSVGLEGTWSGHGKTISVKLRVDGAGYYRPGLRYADLTDETDAEFERRVRGFYDAAIAGRPMDAARFVLFPLRVNSSPRHHMMIRSALELQQKWELVCSADWLKALAATSPHDLPVIDSHAMIGNGLAFFGPKGLEVVNAVP